MLVSVDDTLCQDMARCRKMAFDIYAADIDGDAKAATQSFMFRLVFSHSRIHPHRMIQCAPAT